MDEVDDLPINYLRTDGTNAMKSTLNMGSVLTPHDIINVTNISNDAGSSINLATDLVIESLNGAVTLNSDLPINIPNSLLDMHGNIIENVGEPFEDGDAANKKYVDE